ncbi:Asp-tRNA(Asn)/Glu-tRNA(Gln) amidotransferase subunit GatC [Microbacterium sp. APC 3898]|jgi:aspartyl-tRNA(Asn)/glutamyl-tRNA(Gln) amidotransferase subunit C|uniref:Aspartyl/glutamyl-tRNA(Asn/Gln) amidotransferase subunit C n=2 Tax=Planococcus TaxID=1372 RepID=A0ABT7ZPD7_9BACL|nr:MULTISPECIES: Asp-tRNA(Asn)/Glu-tRNA(Gln) amidotransferase subunit GatC [Terrabacteria group]MBD8016639.1 Asp-tRNA(Asn)/Glu-tRNA(Gln) amidotransferase subunit GatC [Planococcus wigleyi]MDN3428927.1 Asp-tRNA(Asn)/Glu-tRNA(Gln) amidotransferase subunit GatC [Planococcus sp. APC 4016]MDN3439733.1 Asp-tRNA(Asn)/Glu-tRNA(Gln) amidotransferase subunit GatC [Planococcus sp. APC 3900]MDN3500631.1 Asp-tRNA(Asn)/Glu-tRNA(Gln) amidotransferase subunit GatC [Microbacterium sp. APC 3898]TWT02976.1 Asp-t
MAKMTKEEVIEVAHLARLAITDEEAEHFADQLEAITNAMELLNELDTENVEPTTHVLQMVNVLREDKSIPGLDRELMLKNVKEHEGGQVKVPTILE